MLTLDRSKNQGIVLTDDNGKVLATIFLIKRPTSRALSIKADSSIGIHRAEIFLSQETGLPKREFMNLEDRGEANKLADMIFNCDGSSSQEKWSGSDSHVKRVDYSSEYMQAENIILRDIIHTSGDMPQNFEENLEFLVTASLKNKPRIE